MANIRSAHEIAQEKLSNVGDSTEEERLRWKYFPQGEKLAVIYLDKNLDFNKELAKFDEKAKQYILAGAEKVLMANIDLPKNEIVRKRNDKIINALSQVKLDKQKVKMLINKIQQLFNHYSEQGKQQQKQAYESLKIEFSSKLQQAVEQQLGSVVGGLDMNVENLPQFKEEWQRTLIKMDEQYIKILNEYKHEFKNIE